MFFNPALLLVLQKLGLDTVGPCETLVADAPLGTGSVHPLGTHTTTTICPHRISVFRPTCTIIHLVQKGLMTDVSLTISFVLL